MCRPPSSGRVRRRACGLPYPAIGRRSRPSVALHVCFLTGAPRRRRPGHCPPFHRPFSRAHLPPCDVDRLSSPAVSDEGGGGDSPARRPGADGRCTSPVALPRTLPRPFWAHRYVDRPQVPMEFRHRPGTAPGPAGDTPFAPPPAIQLRSRR